MFHPVSVNQLFVLGMKWPISFQSGWKEGGGSKVNKCRTWSSVKVEEGHKDMSQWGKKVAIPKGTVSFGDRRHRIRSVS